MAKVKQTEIGFFERLNIRVQQFLFSPVQQQVLLEDISAMINDGIPPNKAVETLAKMAKGQRALALDNIMFAVAQGRPFSDGLIGWFPQHIVELVRAGEEGGTMAVTMGSAAASLTTRSDIVTSLLASMLYPITVIVVGLSVTIYINNSILKQFSTIKPVAEWPDIGRNLVAFANFVQSWWWLVAAIVVISAILIGIMFKNYIGPFRSTVDVVPGLSIYRKLTAAQFMETLGLLVSNGVVFKNALKILQLNATPYLAWHIMLMEYRLGGGKENIAEVLDTGLLDESDVLRLRVIAEVKGFDHALVRQGHNAMDKNVKMVKTIGKMTGAVFLALGGALAAFLVLGIYNVGSMLAS